MWPSGFDANPVTALGNNQVNPTQDTTDIGHNYYPSPSPQPVQRRVSGTNRNSVSYHTIPFPQPALHGTTMQPTGYQHHYFSDGRHLFMQPHAPIPQHAGYACLPSPPRSDSSHSHYGTGLVQHEQPMPHRVSVQPNRSAPNPPPVAQPHSNTNSQAQIPTPFSAPSDNPDYTFNPSSYGQSASYLGITPPDQRVPSYPPNNGLSFPEPQPPAQLKRKRARGSPGVQSGREKRKRDSRSNEPPVASSSRVTLDEPPPQEPSAPTARKKGRKPQTEVNIPARPMWTIIDEFAPKAQKKDADRKHNDRIRLRHWLDAIDNLLGKPIVGHELKILDKSECRVETIRMDILLTEGS